MTTNKQLMDGHHARALEGSSPLTDADCLIPDPLDPLADIAFVVVDGIVKLPLLCKSTLSTYCL